MQHRGESSSYAQMRAACPPKNECMPNPDEINGRQHHCLISSSIPQPKDSAAYCPPEMHSTQRSKSGGGGGGGGGQCGSPAASTRPPSSHVGARGTSSPPVSRLRRSPPPPPPLPPRPPRSIFSRRWGLLVPPRPHFLRGNSSRGTGRAEIT